jgi:type I restriction enzyme S subunit
MVKFRWETEFKETEIGEIPKDWENSEIGRFIIIRSGKRPKEVKVYGSYEVWGANGFMGYTDYTDHLENREVLITGRVGTLGNVFYIKKNSNVWLSDNVLVLYPDDQKINLKFVFYHLLTRREDIINLDVGSTQPLITQNGLKNLIIPLPPLPEQSRIATVLSWFDDLIEVKKRQNEILEKTAMAIFKSWFIDFEPFREGKFVYNEELGREIPRGWEVKKWGDVVNFFDNQRIPLSEVERLERKGQYPYYGANGIIDYIDDYIFDGKYLLVAEDGTIMDKNGFAITNIVEGKFWANNHVHVIQGKNVPIDYLYLHLKHYPIEPYATGAVQPKLSQENFSKMPILLPPPPILQSFHSLVEPLFQKIILNQKQIMVLRKIRDALLPLLVFGRLRVEEI